MKPYSIMHISDLHRSTRDSISNEELLSALVNDRERYTREEPSIAAPQAIIVSGDIIQGVRLGTENFALEIEDQYAVAEEFLDELVSRFLDGDRSRLIMVPGNHDVDWNTAYQALEPVHTDSVTGDIKAELYAEDSLLRWDWKNFQLYRISNTGLYEQRLAAFWRFFDRFYDGVSGLMTSQNPADARLFSLCDDRIGVAAYNSCHGNDCFAFHGMIQQGSIARSDLLLRDSGKTHDLRIAVWHHSIDGSPYRTDYMDCDVVRGMIGRGFRLGLHGHQHKAQATAQEIFLPDRERMAVVSAGSLCAGANQLPVGTPRQYNVLEIASDFRSVRSHVRAMNVANLFSRAQLPEFGERSYFDLTWCAPRNAVGSQIDVLARRRDTLIDQAEMAAKSGKHSQAVSILKALRPLEAGSYERQLFLQAATDGHDWKSVIDATDPPTTINELMQRFNAYCKLNDSEAASTCVKKFSEHLHLPEAQKLELLARAGVRGALGQ